MNYKEKVLQMSREMGCKCTFYDDEEDWKKECGWGAWGGNDYNRSPEHDGIHVLYINERITRLEFYGDFIYAIPEYINIFFDLTELHIDCPKLTTLPSSIGNLYMLKKLVITGCVNLKSLPETIGNLLSLEYLVIFSVAIKTFPESIGKLSKLKGLNCYYCEHLYELPESIGNLSALEYLTICYSSIKELPKSIINLSGLNYTVPPYKKVVNKITDV